jgi:hypothetical protein
MFIFKDTKKRANEFAPYTDADGTRYPRIPAELLEEVDDPVPPDEYLINPDYYYRTEQDDAPYVVYTRKSDKQIAEALLAKAKAQRISQVEAITVTTASGKEFDGNEDAQNRMSRALTAMEDSDQLPWVLHDNTVAMISKAEMLEALRLAGAAMAAIWVAPYTQV